MTEDTKVYYDCPDCKAISSCDPPRCWACGGNRLTVRAPSLGIYSTHRVLHRDMQDQLDVLRAACELANERLLLLGDRLGMVLVKDVCDAIDAAVARALPKCP
jgi:hypothetical protein